MLSYEEILQINQAHPWFFAFWAFVFGACWGSFMNVVIYRVPAGKSVVKPGSHCYACNTPIKWYDNLPILSWFILRGKARCCGAPFSVRYALIEALTGGLYMWTWIIYHEHFMVVAILWLFIALMIGGAFVDFDTQLLPNLFTVWGLVIGFLLSFFFPELHGQSGSGDPMLLEQLRSAALSATGAVVGTGVILWIAMLAEVALRKEAMGFGDVLFMGCIGAFIGWKGAIFSIFGGALLGTAVVIPLMLVNSILGTNLTPGKTSNPVDENSDNPEEATAKKAVEAEVADESQENAESTDAKEDGDGDEELGIGVAIPFGPWLALGALVYLLVAREWVDNYFDSMQSLIFAPVQM
ncbi:MAG: prepilin peptidase [Verrucomicrobiota bacterium]